jgi:multidrug efflux pump
MRPLEAALHGAQEIGFTVLSMTLSLVAVFIPILMMAGIVGRLFREFAVTLSVSILVSLLVSLTMTPMMCSRLLKREQGQAHGRIYRINENAFDSIVRVYDRGLKWVLGHEAFTLGNPADNDCRECLSSGDRAQGIFPLGGHRQSEGGIRASQDISFQAMEQLTSRFVNIIKSDPAVASARALYWRQWLC